MARNKGTGLNNVKETWEQNERLRRQGGDSSGDSAAGVSRDLEQTIREEAAEYDNANKEDRVLDGDRATVNDERGGAPGA